MTKNPLPRLGQALRTLQSKHKARHSPSGFDIALAALNLLVKGLVGLVHHAEAPERNPFG